MASTLHGSSTWLVMMALSAVFVMAFPLLFLGHARKRLGVGWKYLWFGALVFLVFQLLTRVPIFIGLQATVLALRLSSSIPFTWSWLVILAVTAGLFEEIGRYVGYRLLMRREPKTWSKGVMFGLGHEGLESVVLIGGQLVLPRVSVTLLSALPVNSLPAAQLQTVLQQFAAINVQPIWFPLLTAWERLWSFPLQVALAVLVLHVFLRQQLRWLGLATLLHALIDFVTAALPRALGQGTTIALLVEGIVCVFGLLGVRIIWRLREPGDPLSVGEESLPTNYQRAPPIWSGLLVKLQEKGYDHRIVSPRERNRDDHRLGRDRKTRCQSR
jgi:uncharacterized membrane protein YhfC